MTDVINTTQCPHCHALVRCVSGVPLQYIHRVGKCVRPVDDSQSVAAKAKEATQ